MREFTSRAERRRGEAVLARRAYEQERSVAVPIVSPVEEGEGLRELQGNAPEGESLMPSGVYAHRRAVVSERFWSKVERRGPDECWPWLANRNEKGYGRFRGAGRGGGDLKAHRVAWELTHGPTDLQVLHRCDNPPCCNPDHLFLGTNLDNVHDSISKGRKPIGSRNPSARLTEEAIREVRRLRTQGTTQTEIARRLGVHSSTISAIDRGVAWRHVDDEVAQKG
jgi:DNA-binding XRE family transcriptional regulator